VVPGTRLLAGTAAGVLLGLLTGFLLCGRESGQSLSAGALASSERVRSSGSSGAESEGARLRAALARESARRAELEARLAVLEARLAARAEPPPTPSGSSEPATIVPDPAATGGWPDERVLAQAGFDPGELEDLRARIEAIELERLYLRDQATREGWFGRPRFRNEMQRLNAKYGELQAEVGDEAYDWMLFASGRENRVVVQRVMQGSPAAEAGLEEGDVLLRYDDARIFDTSSLQQASLAGRAGDTVAVDVHRRGEPLRLYLPRGPLGIGTGGASMPPEPR
jgi:membrane-associated protease RseP (regulator of RpoE activity)